MFEGGYHCKDNDKKTKKKTQTDSLEEEACILSAENTLEELELAVKIKKITIKKVFDERSKTECP